jgi:hypothetical protein
MEQHAMEQCVDVAGSMSGVDGSLPLHPCNSSARTQLFVYNATDGHLASKANGQCLNVANCKGPVVSVFDCSDEPGCGKNEKFIFSVKDKGRLGLDALATGTLKDGDGHCMAASSSGMNQLWTKPLPNSKLAVLVVNGGSSKDSLTIAFAEIPGTNGPQHVRDIWAKKDLGVHTVSMTVTLEAHGSLFAIFTPKA